MGNRWSDKERERYDLKTLVDSAEPLQSIGVEAKEIDAVLLSHLHFDHAGGATVLKDGKLVPTFPNAKYYSQLGEWEFAHNANGRAKASYRPDDYEPLKSAGQLVLAEGDMEIAPGVWLKVTGGHTSHHQVIYFESRGNKGVFFADIIPTASHLTPPWVMGYDHFPLAVCDLKSEWLARAAKEGWLAVFDHEPESPWGKVIEEGGKFKFLPISQNEAVFHSEVRSAVAP